MRLEWMNLFVVWLITLGLVFIIPKRKRRIAIVAFLFTQVITWILGLVVVEYGLIAYPVRDLPTINYTSLTFEFLSFTVLCGVVNAYYPHARSKMMKFLYFASFCTILTILEVIIEKYTDLIEYLHWSWYLTWISLFISFMLSRWFCVWFFKGIAKEMEE
ncbi:hypothetical protein PH210_23610 [Paenibacillus sp. BSR1-1]|uniref:CBO0543 family protein n=1 Tax=Paenibacillus sp. BSR1-1 TaxID=3020845 RepID=UPI0025AEF4FD|nr:CBO0543 family protein [Paenibacillus sp. BSR1-1]MDN3019164.1 hypothetical protein [Paenibacillus sp. BSR1-1]